MGEKFTGGDKLIQQKNALASNTNEKSFKTIATYSYNMNPPCHFLWEKFHLQKISNIEGKHIRAYVKHMQEQGLSPATIKSRLSAIRFFHRLAGGKKRLPDNKELGLEKRKVGTEDRAWTVDEVKAGMEVAKNMGRIDAYHAICIGYAFGLRVEEICRVRLEDIEKAMTNDGLRVKGKGGQIRIVPVEVEVQKKLLKYLYNCARNNHLLPRDYIISRNEDGGVERQIGSLEKWMYTNRHKFAMQNRETEAREGLKPRSKDLTWHGLRYKRAQEQYAMYEAEGRQTPKLMTSEILGHHRTDITKIYLAELPQSKKNQWEAIYGPKV